MQINAYYLDNLKVEAQFDDFKVLTDQPVRYKGDGMAPSPFDYFLASSALCAAYFVKVYCKARNIPTDDIRVTQDNIVDPENRYKQTFAIQVELPESISEKDRAGIIASIDRCTVKKTIQASPEFKIVAKTVLGQDSGPVFDEFLKKDSKTIILGKDCSLEETIKNMTNLLDNLGIKIEISSWRNPVPGVWSVHIRDADSPICFSNGKGATKESALCSALGEYLERLSTNYFYSDYYLGEENSHASFVHYPNEKWFQIENEDKFPIGLMDEHLFSIYEQDGELKPQHLIDSNSGNPERGICALPYTRQSDNQEVYIPVNLIANLYVSNGMSAGNSKYEARVQALSEIFERAVKNKIILEEISLPDVPLEVLKRYPKILEGIRSLEEKGYPVYVKDASLGGLFPVTSVTLMNPKTGGVFASFGAHPSFEVALERSLTELLQGRSFEGLNEMPAPTFNYSAISEHNNIIDHFIDSTGVISWKFFSESPDYEFNHWDYTGTTEEEFNYLMNILKQLEKEVYIADYNDLGTPACRILVPDYSEIYLKEDLIWDNCNRAQYFRKDILNLHSLDEEGLNRLVENLEESELDNYMPVGELIGVAFDDASTWGELVIGELKALCLIKLNRLEDAKSYIEMFQSFHNHSPSRVKFFRLLDIVLDIAIDQEMDFINYKNPLINMYGSDLLDSVEEIVFKNSPFLGLTPTNNFLQGIEKHQRMLESYKKLHEHRS